MSYILEALKRADAERQRGAVPGLLASQVTTPLAKAAPDGRQRAVWIALAVLALAGVAVGLWRWRMPAAPAPLVQTEAVPAQVPVPAATLPNAVVAASAQRGVATPRPTTAAAAVPAMAASMPVTSKPKPLAHAAPASAASPPLAAAEPVAVAVTPVPQASGPPAALADVALADVALLGELPEALRRQIPALSVTGVVYSTNPAQRLLVVNNQVLTQGSVAAPEVNLEEIQPKSSVFSFRGTRFRVAH